MGGIVKSKPKAAAPAPAPKPERIIKTRDVGAEREAATLRSRRGRAGGLLAKALPSEMETANTLGAKTKV
ncbi:hypothetical protein MEP301_gp42 [Methylophilales phage MEP301]|nr:hypothetical protein MEP301_gp42 [Methylophilales phage MEP301]